VPSGEKPKRKGVVHLAEKVQERLAELISTNSRTSQRRMKARKDNREGGGDPKRGPGECRRLKDLLEIPKSTSQKNLPKRHRQKKGRLQRTRKKSLKGQADGGQDDNDLRDSITTNTWITIKVRNAKEDGKKDAITARGPK